MARPCSCARYPIPTISSFLSKPFLTPLTMLATSDRARPWSARTLRSSPAREMTSTLFSTFALSPEGTGWASLPLGPSARTVAPSTWTFTPCGMGMGFRPIRDMGDLSPHVGEDFSAHSLLARVAVRQDAPRRRQQGDAHTAEDRRDPLVRDVDAPPRGRHAHEPRDHPLVGHAVLEIDAQHALLPVLEQPEVLDEALLLEELRDAHLEPRGRDVHLLVLRPARVADPGQHVGDGIAAHGLPARLHDARHLALERELAEAQPAHLELPEIRARAPAQLAPVVRARRELRRALRLHDEGGLRHTPATP